MITYQNGTSWKKAKEGRIVDLRHKYNIESNNGLYSETNISEVIYDGDHYAVGTITYEKSFYTSGGIRYLLEEWYTNNPSTGENKYLYRRMTPYTEEDYAFTLGISGISGVESYLYNGNPENTGFVNPLTGQYEIGEFNAKKKELITQQVTQQLEYYVMQHNQYAGAYGITYDFTLPELSDTDWTNALSDITVIAFVQGIPILGQQYYNNYGLAGSNIVDKEFFIGYDDGMTTPKYYSSRILDKTNAEFVKRLSMVDIFDYSKEAAQVGYYPDITRDPSVLKDLIADNINIKIVGRVENTDTIELTIDGGSKGGTYIDKVLYMGPAEGREAFYDPLNSSKIHEVSSEKIIYNKANNTITVIIDKIAGAISHGILIRDVDGRTKYISSGVTIIPPVVPPPVIPDSLIITGYHDGSNIKLTIKNLDSDNGNLIITKKSFVAGDVGSIFYNNTIAGDGEYTYVTIPASDLGNYVCYIERATDSTDNDQCTVTITKELKITNVEYDQDNNKIKVTITGLEGNSATLNWKTRNTRADENKTISSGYNNTTITITPDAEYIPDEFDFTITDPIGRTDSSTGHKFYPKIKIGIWVSDVGNRTIRVESTTVMNRPTKIEYTKYKANEVEFGGRFNKKIGRYYEQYYSGTASINMSSNNKLSTGTSINFDYPTDDPGYICLTIKVNGMDLIYNIRYISKSDDLVKYNQWLRPDILGQPNGVPTAAQLGSSSNLVEIHDKY